MHTYFWPTGNSSNRDSYGGLIRYVEPQAKRVTICIEHAHGVYGAEAFQGDERCLWAGQGEMTGYPQGFSKDLVETDPPAQVLQPGGNLPLLGQGSWAVRQWAAVEGGLDARWEWSLQCTVKGGAQAPDKSPPPTHHPIRPMSNFIIDREQKNISFGREFVVASATPGFSARSSWHLPSLPSPALLLPCSPAAGSGRDCQGRGEGEDEIPTVDRHPSKRM